ncbi:MAG: TonB-dependent receptor [Prevotellaceae bacterium]|jgi:TonB-linked SusC/RagA family outer membrane protein|nr:TonB-dependent receptor [Prevotellaceae bacterium]
MKKLIKLVLCALLTTLWGTLAAQNVVTGVIIDETGEPLPGSVVQVRGSTRAVATDVDGSFSISVKPEDVLEVSFLGYETQPVTVGGQTKITVQLKPKVDELKEVVVVAFGKQKKESVVASIATISPAELKVPSSNLTTAFAGRIAGVIAYQRSGEPGLDDAQFFIRGVTTFGYKKDPLILIDNNESTSQELSRMQPDDIASFSILKDATATALYGARGANGVIMVSTKEGKEGKAKINIRYEEALSMPTQMVELADPITYMNLHNEAIRTRNPLGQTMYSDYKIQNTIAGTNPYVFPATNWYDKLFKDFANNHRLNMNVSGGGNVAQYYIAGSLINDNGVLNVDKRNNFNSNVNLNRYMLRTNVNINITKTTQAIVRLSGSFDDYSGPINGGSDVYRQVMNTNPVLFPAYYEPDENYKYSKHILFGNYGDRHYVNPYAEMVKGYKESTTSVMTAQFELKQKLDFITEGLSARAMFNTSRYSYFDVTRAYNPYFYSVSNYDKNANTYLLDELNVGRESLSYAEGEKKVSATTYFESSLNWNRSFAEKHEVGGMMVFTIRNELVGNASSLQKSLPYRNMNLAGRLTYAYGGRYLFEGNFGYNGSERFAKKERFGFFPSGGIGWVISNEGFYGEGLKSVLSNLKLKATYGLAGNDAIGTADERFFYLSQVTMNSGERASSFGTNGDVSLSGVRITRYANEDITWEIAKKMNVTAEIGLFNELDFQAEYFREQRSNILMTRQDIPTSMGLETTAKSNVGEASGHGVDMSLNFNHSFGAKAWLTAMANFTYATSEYTVYEEPQYPDAPWKSHVGYPLSQRWGYIAERLFVDDAEVYNSPVQFGNYMGGDIKYKDLNSDGKINELDMAPIGYPSEPEIIYGFGASAGYRSFDFSFFFQGSARSSFWIIDPGVDPVINTAPFLGGQSALMKAYADSHWSEENRDIYAVWPRLSPTTVENNNQLSTWFMRDGSFLRLKSIEVGYSLPEKIISRIHLSQLRIYFSGTNLLTFSKFKLWDPEMGGNGLGYPVQKVFNLGVQVSF